MSAIQNYKSEIVNISTLKPNPKNPRSFTKSGIERLMKQIKRLSQYKPIIVDSRTGLIVGGHGRYEALKLLGIEDVLVSYITSKDDSEALEYSFSDNERSGFYDDDLLANLIPEYPEFNWEDYAVDLKEPQLISDLLDQFKEVEEDEAPPLSDEPAKSELGKVYQLGRHRLGCLDATKIEDVELLMGGQKADMVFTDPPYNVDYEGGNGLKIKNDKMSDSNFYDFLLASFTNLATSIKRGGAVYICHADLEGLNFRGAFKDSGFALKTTIIWNKTSLVMGRGDYHWKHESILYGWIEGAAHNWFGDRSQTSVWDIDKPRENKQHPTMKPVALIAKTLKNSSKTDDIVLDVFAGSGSTLVACEETNRTAYVMELDPKYADVIRKRYCKLIGKEDNWEEETPEVTAK